MVTGDTEANSEGVYNRVANSVVAKADHLEATKKASVVFAEKADPVFQKKLRSLQQFKFKDESDVVSRFPYPDELHDEGDGVYSWHQRVIVTQDIVQGILKTVFSELPPSTGRIKFNSVLKADYLCISSPQIIAFLAANDLHQQFRQRRRSQKTKPTVSTRPFSVIACDLTDIPVRGSIRYILVAVDLFSKFCWTRPLAKKNGPIVAREIGSILASVPEGAKLGILRSDNGPEFKNPEVTAVLQQHGMRQIFSTPANPLSNGAIEILNRTLKTSLFSLLHGDGTIASFGPALKRVVNLYNNSIHTATGFFPSQLANPHLPQAIIKQIRDKLNGLAGSKQPNLRYQPMLEPGDKVRIDTTYQSNATRQQVKAGTFKSSHQATFSSEIYTVVKQRSDNQVSVVEIPNELYPRGAFLLVPKDTQ